MTLVTMHSMSVRGVRFGFFFPGSHFLFNKRASNQFGWTRVEAGVEESVRGSIYDIIFYMTIFPLNYTSRPIGKDTRGL